MFFFNVSKQTHKYNKENIKIIFSNHLLFIDRQLEIQPQHLRRLSA